jgi:hypothetical protein
MAQFNQPMNGWVGIQKTGDSSISNSLTLNETRYLLATDVTPLNPVNKTFLPCMNVSQYEGIFCQDGKTGVISVRGYVDPKGMNAGSQGLMDYKFMNSLVLGGTLDYPDLFAVCVNNGDTSRIFDACRINSIAMSQMATGGPVNVEISFLSAAPDSADIVGYTESTFSAPTLKYGQIFDRSSTSVSTGLTDTTMWSLQIMRQAEHDFSFNATNTVINDMYPSDIRSQNFRGSLNVIQRDRAGTVISDSGSVTITLGNGSTPLSQANGKTVMLCYVQQQNLVKNIRVGSANYINNEFQLVRPSAGGVPIVFS